MATMKDDRTKIEEIEDDEDQNIEDEAGEEQDDAQDNSNNSNESTPKQSTKKEKTFSQAQVTKMMTKEKNQGRNAVYKELGINPKDEKQIALVKALIESQTTDADRLKTANSELNEANERARLAEAKAEAMMLGIKSQFVEDAVTLVLAKADDTTDIKTALGELKTKYPVWFGDEDEEDDETSVGKKGTGSSIKISSKGAKGKGGIENLGQKLAAQRKTSTNKNSYWK